MHRFRVALCIVIFIQGAAFVSGETYSLRGSVGLIPGAQSTGAYGIPAYMDLGFEWWPPFVGGYAALGTSLLVAAFVPETDSFGRSILLAPLGGVRGAYPIGESRFVLGAELAAGLYSRWSRFEGRELMARRPVARATAEILFRDAYGWESGIRAGWIGWFDDKPVHSGTLGVLVGRRW